MSRFVELEAEAFVLGITSFSKQKVCIDVDKIIEIEEYSDYCEIYLLGLNEYRGGSRGIKVDYSYEELKKILEI